MKHHAPTVRRPRWGRARRTRVPPTTASRVGRTSTVGMPPASGDPFMSGSRRLRSACPPSIRGSPALRARGGHRGHSPGPQMHDHSGAGRGRPPRAGPSQAGVAERLGQRGLDAMGQSPISPPRDALVPSATMMGSALGTRRRLPRGSPVPEPARAGPPSRPIRPGPTERRPQRRSSMTNEHAHPTSRSPTSPWPSSAARRSSWPSTRCPA